MIYVRCKVTCDICKGREEVFDAPMTLPEGWTWREDYEGVAYLDPPLVACPRCIKVHTV